MSDFSEETKSKSSDSRERASASSVVKLIRTIVICITLIVIAVIAVILIRGGKSVTVESVNIILSQSIEDDSELVTKQLKYTGLARETKGVELFGQEISIPFLTKKGVEIKYEAEVKAGIDPKSIKVESVTSDKVTISVPKSSVLSKAVDLDSVEIVGEDNAIFGEKKSEIMRKVYAKAQENLDSLVAGGEPEEDAEKLDIDKLLSEADKGVDSTLHGILDGAIGKRSLEIIRE